VEGLEWHKLYGDLRRELRRLWFDRERRLVEIRQMEAELGLARMQVQKVSTLLVAQDASLDAVKEAEVAMLRIEAAIAGKQIDVKDLTEAHESAPPPKTGAGRASDRLSDLKRFNELRFLSATHPCMRGQCVALWPIIKPESA
jgi:hypothetical protein